MTKEEMLRVMIEVVMNEAMMNVKNEQFATFHKLEVANAQLREYKDKALAVRDALIDILAEGAPRLCEVYKTCIEKDEDKHACHSCYLNDALTRVEKGRGVEKEG